MSLLGTPVYANTSTPLWVSVNGGTVTGNLTVDGTLAVDGPAQFFGGHTVKIANPSTLYLANTGQSQAGALLYSDDAATPNGYVETNAVVYLGRIGAGNTANTAFTPSAAGTDGDLLEVGGQILTAPGGGITPLVSSTATTNITVGGPSIDLSPSPVIPITTGLTYEIEVKGFVTIPLLTAPAAGDKFELIVSVGPGALPGAYRFTEVYDMYPGFVDDPWVAGSFRPFSIRTRLPSNANLANIVVSGTLTGAGTYPAGIDVEIPQVSVVRVA